MAVQNNKTADKLTIQRNFMLDLMNRYMLVYTYLLSFFPGYDVLETFSDKFLGVKSRLKSKWT